MAFSVVFNAQIAARRARLGAAAERWQWPALLASTHRRVAN